MQALGCFLSHANVVGSIQAKLVLKATILCEASGLFIDVVTSDGAMWNRAMWKAFKAENSNKLGVYIRVTRTEMARDFPHLLK
jgi:hypothetical protein